jgi:hypothetical protein
VNNARACILFHVAVQSPGNKILGTSILISTRMVKSVAKYSIVAISASHRETFGGFAHKTLSGFTNGITFRNIFTASQQEADFQNFDKNCHVVNSVTLLNYCKKQVSL